MTTGDGWERAFTSERADEEGRVVLGDPNSGCKHCGSVSRKVSENGLAVLYHPSVACCEASAREQVSFRQADLARLRDEWGARQALIHEKAQELENTGSPSDRRQMELDLRRMEAGLLARTRDYYQPLAAEYEEELAVANSALRVLLEPPSLGLRE